jgi:hypothetical protein
MLIWLCLCVYWCQLSYQVLTDINKNIIDRETNREKEDNSCLIESGSLIKLNWQKNVSIVAVARVVYKERHARAHTKGKQRHLLALYSHSLFLSDAYFATAVRDKRTMENEKRERETGEKISFSLYSFLFWSMLIDAFKCHVDLHQRQQQR